MYITNIKLPAQQNAINFKIYIVETFLFFIYMNKTYLKCFKYKCASSAPELIRAISNIKCKMKTIKFSTMRR